MNFLILVLDRGQEVNMLQELSISPNLKELKEKIVKSQQDLICESCSCFNRKNFFEVYFEFFIGFDRRRTGMTETRNQAFCRKVHIDVGCFNGKKSR